MEEEVYRHPGISCNINGIVKLMVKVIIVLRAKVLVPVMLMEMVHTTSSWHPIGQG